MKIVVVPELIKMWFWISFLIVMFVSFVLSINGDLDKDDNMVRDVYGVNSFCIYLDYPPSTYVSPSMWSGSIIFFSFYSFSQALRVNLWREEGLMTEKTYLYIQLTLLLELMCTMFFSTIFAISVENAYVHIT